MLKMILNKIGQRFLQKDIKSRKPKLKIRKKVTFEEIQKAAYLKWEAAGKPAGNDLYFWLEAEKDFK